MTRRACIVLGMLVVVLVCLPGQLRAAPPRGPVRPAAEDYERYQEGFDDSYRFGYRGNARSRGRHYYEDEYDSPRMAHRQMAYERQVEEVDRPPMAPGGGPVGDGPVYMDGGEGAYEGGAYFDGPYEGGGPYSDGPGGYGPYGYYYGGGGCGDDCCGDDCWSLPGPVYARAEYLLWWMTGDSAPPLVTTSTPGTARAQAGVLGLPSTSILFGDSTLNTSGRSGGRLVVGWWADCTCRLEGEFFVLGRATDSFNQFSSGDPILARPFFNLTTAAQDANVVAFPGELEGGVNATETSTFLGAGVRVTKNMLCHNDDCNRTYRIDCLAGYRYLQLKDTLTINGSTATTVPVGGLPAGTSLATHDSFSTGNAFNGLDVGMMIEKRECRWCFTGIGRLALGCTTERVNIDGNSTTTVRGIATTSEGGLLAMPSNIGSYRHNGFSLVPQLELKVGYDFSECLRFTCGYDVLYWSRVVRPAEQVDTWVNTSQSSGQPLVGVPGPLFAFNESDLWVQGISFGGEFRY